MKTRALAATIILMTACSTSQERQQALVNKIEKQVRLPTGAHPVTQYERYYANGEDGQVLGVYLLPPDPWRGGQRHWLNNANDLPFVDGGGCSEVNVIFDKSTSTITHVGCNGGA